MRAIKSVKHALLATTLAAVSLAGSVGNASAYVACNRFGDCWHTDTRIHLPGMRLTFHPDSWWDRHKNNHHYSWHDADSSHDWHHGYWNHGTWHAV